MTTYIGQLLILKDQILPISRYVR